MGRMPFPQRQKTHIRVYVFTALLLIYIDIYQTVIYKYIHTTENVYIAVMHGNKQSRNRQGDNHIYVYASGSGEVKIRSRSYAPKSEQKALQVSSPPNQ